MDYATQRRVQINSSRLMDQMGQNSSHPAIVVDGSPSPNPATSRISAPEPSSCNGIKLMPTLERLQPQTPLVIEGLDPNSSPFNTPPSAQPPRPSDKVHLLDHEETVNFDRFDLNNFTREEVHNHNAMAEPGQRLQDVVSPLKVQGLMQNASSRSKSIF